MYNLIPNLDLQATNDYCSGSKCQQGFGQCKVAYVPICNVADASASGRTVGYWQSSNTQRSCDTVTPKQINTSGLTHLYYAFVTVSVTVPMLFRLLTPPSLTKPHSRFGIQTPIPIVNSLHANRHHWKLGLLSAVATSEETHGLR